MDGCGRLRSFLAAKLQAASRAVCSDRQLYGVAARELLNGDSMVEPSLASHTPPPSLFAARGHQETMMLFGACALPVAVCTFCGLLSRSYNWG